MGVRRMNGEWMRIGKSIVLPIVFILVGTSFLLPRLKLPNLPNDENDERRTTSQLLEVIDTIDTTKEGPYEQAVLHTSDIETTIKGYPFNGISNVHTSNLSYKSKHRPTGLLWQIPRTGSTTLRYILGTCLDLVQASRTSKDYCDVETDVLHVCHSRFGAYVNADTSDNHGIQRAHELNLISSELADVVVSSRFLHVASLFSETYPARAFTLIRCPMERTISTFETDLEFAKMVLKKKFLVLLTGEMKASVDRLIQFMGWNVEDDQIGCIQENVAKFSNERIRPKMDLSPEESQALKQKNKLDQELYEYAIDLFSEQWSLIFRGVGAQYD